MSAGDGRGPALRLLGKAASINVRKVLWSCHELDLAIEREDWGSGFRDPAAPEFLALNPNGLVPVLVDGDFVLWESNTICRYLAARQGRHDLLPAEPGERAHVEQWMDWQATELNNSWRTVFMARVRHSAAHQDPAALAAGEQAWTRHMRILEAQLARGGPYALGQTFTLADVVLGLSVQRWLMTPMQRPELPAVQAYHAHLGRREGFRLHGDNGLP